MSFIVRRATLEDLDVVAPLFTGYREFYRKDPSPNEEREFLEARLRNRDSVIFIAADSNGQRALGFTQLYPMFSSVRMRRLWILNDLFVDKTARGEGSRRSSYENG